MSEVKIHTSASVDVIKSSPLSIEKKPKVNVALLILEVCFWIVCFPLFGAIIITGLIFWIIRYLFHFFVNLTDNIKLVSFVRNLIFIAFLVIMTTVTIYCFSGYGLNNSFPIFHNASLTKKIDLVFFQNIDLSSRMYDYYTMDFILLFKSILRIDQVFGSFNANFENFFVFLQWLATNILMLYILILLLIGSFTILFIDEYINRIRVSDYQKICLAISQHKSYKKPKRYWLNRVAFWLGYHIFIKTLQAVEHRSLLNKNKIDPYNGVVISFEKNHQVILLKEAWAKNICYLGGTRSGKTNNILNLVSTATYNDYCVIYLDVTDSLSVQEAFKQMALNMYVPFSMWRPTFEHEKNIPTYNPFDQKSPTECGELIKATLSHCFRDETYMRLIGAVINYMIAELIPINFINFARYTDPIFLVSDVANKKDTSINQAIRTVVADYHHRVSSFLNEIHHEITNFNRLTKTVISSEAQRGVSMINIINGTPPLGYFNASPNLPGLAYQQLQRLYFKDFLITLRNHKSTRPIMLVIHRIHNLFDSVGEVSKFFQLMKAEHVCVITDVLVNDKPNIHYENIIREVITNSSNLFIHNMYEEYLNTIIQNLLKNTRVVRPLYQFVDLNRKYNQRYIHDITLEEENDAAVRKQMIENLKNIPAGKIILKTIDNYCNQNTNVFYNTYMNTVQFTSYLTWISSLIKPRVIDRYELHKVTKK